MMFLKFAVFILLVVTCLAQPQAHGRQLAGSSALTIDCNDQAAVAEAVRTNADFRCDTQALRASFKKCPEGQIFNSELGACINNPNVKRPVRG